MTQALVSVKNASECALALANGVALIDMKQPSQGALGALELPLVQQLVEQIQGRALTSATLGDIPPHHPAVPQKIAAMQATGVDVIKLAMLDITHAQQALSSLQASAQHSQLIAVLFAEQTYPDDILSVLAEVGFVGVMWDTQYKQYGLRHYFTALELQAFVQKCRALGLLCGLAGALQIIDWHALQPLQADYLGFRGGLCDNGRAGDLSADKLSQLMQATVQVSTPAAPSAAWVRVKLNKQHEYHNTDSLVREI
jgi:uncharacterized protein (UPF0264 family)